MAFTLKSHIAYKKLDVAVENGIYIKGRESEFVGISPKEQGLYKEKTWFTDLYKGKYEVSAYIKNRYLTLDGKIN